MDDPLLLDDHAVSKLTGRARGTLQKDRLCGRGIPFVRLGRLARYRPADVAAYIAALPSFRSTAEADAGRQRAADVSARRSA